MNFLAQIDINMLAYMKSSLLQLAKHLTAGAISQSHKINLRDSQKIGAERLWNFLDSRKNYEVSDDFYINSIKSQGLSGNLKNSKTSK